MTKRATRPSQAKLPAGWPSSAVLDVELTDVFAETFAISVMRYVAAHSKSGWVYREDSLGVRRAYLLEDIEVDEYAGSGSGNLDLKGMFPVGPITEHIHFKPQAMRGLKVSQFLARVGLMVETTSLRAEYESYKQVYRDIVLGKIGQPYRVRGRVYDAFDCDLNDIDASNFSSRFLSSHHAGNQPVIIDCLLETGELPFDAATWVSVTSDYAVDVESLLSEKHNHGSSWYGGREKYGVTPTFPVQPYVSIYNLKERRRQVTHVSSLRPDPLDVVAAKSIPLIADPKLTRVLSKALRYRSGEQEDIVAGKSGGAILLLHGEPGTGKTLTAEVCSRRCGRVLYPVQCAEVGLDYRSIERKLRVVFDRATRWGAVLLFDEADLFILKRDNDMQRSAIVQAFLRVLEYQDAIVFMTTNVPLESIDTGAINRCLVCYQFGILAAKDREALWKALASHYDVTLPDGAAEELSELEIPGREIKRVLRLAAILTTSEENTATRLRNLQKFGTPYKG